MKVSKYDTIFFCIGFGLITIGLCGLIGWPAAPIAIGVFLAGGALLPDER